MMTQPISHLFITGTDTNVGKTYVTCALLHALRQKFPDRRVGAMKPVAAGTNAQGRNDDVEHLKAAANITLPERDMTPYLFAPPVAPHLAAKADGIHISIQKILQHWFCVRQAADHVLVEGVGGFRVPLCDTTDTADLATTLNLPVILVVGLRLGCLNHALLTAEAIERRGLTLAGWIANNIDPAMAMIEANVDALRTRLSAPLIGHLPHDPSSDPKNAIQHLHISPLDFQAK